MGYVVLLPMLQFLDLYLVLTPVNKSYHMRCDAFARECIHSVCSYYYCCVYVHTCARAYMVVRGQLKVDLQELSFLLLLQLSFIFVFWDRVLLCSPGHLGTYSVDQVDFELTEIPCLCLPGAGFKILWDFFFKKYFFLMMTFKKSSQEFLLLLCPLLIAWLTPLAPLLLDCL